MQIVRQPPLERAVDGDAAEPHAQSIEKTIAESAQPRALGRHLLSANLGSPAEPDDARHVERAGSKSVFVAAAVNLRRKRELRLRLRNEKGAGALRAVQLVARQRQQVDIHRANIDRHLAGRLGGVSVEQRTVLVRDRTNRLERLQRADLVIRGHHRHENRLRRHRPAEPIEIDEAIGLHGEHRDLEAAGAETLARVENGFVLGRNRHDVTAAVPQRLRRPLERKIVRLGGAARENDFRRRRVDERGDLRAGGVDCLVRIPAPGVLAAGRVAEALAEERQHLGEDARVDGRGRVVIEVERPRSHVFPNSEGTEPQRTTPPEKKKTKIAP